MCVCVSHYLQVNFGFDYRIHGNNRQIQGRNTGKLMDLEHFLERIRK